MNRTNWPWHLSVDTTTPALARLAEGLIKTGSRLLGSCVLSTAHGRLGRGISAMLVVDVPETQRIEFAAIVRPYEMTRPPRVSVGLAPPVDDGHPGGSWSIRAGKVQTTEPRSKA